MIGGELKNLLKSLELGNLDTSSVTSMNKMFYNCQSLLSLNLFSFNTKQIQICDDMFYSIHPPFLYCIDEDNIIDSINNQIKIYTKVNCSELNSLISNTK